MWFSGQFPWVRVWFNQRSNHQHLGKSACFEKAAINLILASASRHVQEKYIPKTKLRNIAKIAEIVDTFRSVVAWSHDLQRALQEAVERKWQFYQTNMQWYLKPNSAFSLETHLNRIQFQIIQCTVLIQFEKYCESWFAKVNAKSHTVAKAKES